MTHNEYLNNFIQAHNGSDWRVETSPMEEYGKYIKTYIFDDGAVLTEVNRPVYAQTTATAKGVTVPVEIKLLEIECWNTDNSKSVLFYERW